MLHLYRHVIQLQGIDLVINRMQKYKEMMCWNEHWGQLTNLP
jgi:hypothetical protein